MLKREIGRRWSDVELIDIFKEVDLRLNFTAAFRTTASREVLDPALLQRRLLLCLFGIGTNVGLKCVASQQPGVTVEELRYVKRRFVQKEALRTAIAEVVNGTFRIRNPAIWGDATTACLRFASLFRSPNYCWTGGLRRTPGIGLVERRCIWLLNRMRRLPFVSS